MGLKKQSLFLVLILIIRFLNTSNIYATTLSENIYYSSAKVKTGSKFLFREFKNNKLLIKHFFFFSKTSPTFYKMDTLEYKTLNDTIFLKSIIDSSETKEIIDYPDLDIVSFSVFDSSFIDNAKVLKKTNLNMLKTLQKKAKTKNIQLNKTYYPPITKALNISFLNSKIDSTKITGIWIHNGVEVKIKTKISSISARQKELKEKLANEYINGLYRFVLFDITENISGPARLTKNLKKILDENKILFILAPTSLSFTENTRNEFKIDCSYAIINVKNKTIKYNEEISFMQKIELTEELLQSQDKLLTGLAERLSESYFKKNK